MMMKKLVIVLLYLVDLIQIQVIIVVNPQLSHIDQIQLHQVQ